MKGKLSHIGHFLPYYPEPGAMNSSVSGLCRALTQAGYAVTLYGCGRKQERSSESSNLQNLHTLVFPHESSNPFSLPSPLRDRLRHNTDELDLLVLNGIFSPLVYSAAREARRARIPYVACPRGVYHPELFRKRRLKKVVYWRCCERPLLNAAAAVQLLAEHDSTLLRARGVQTPTFVVPNGFDPVDTPCFTGANGTPHLEGWPVFLYLGRIDMHHKGLDLLLRALSRGIRSGRFPSTVRLYLIGPDWGDQNRLVTIAARLGIGENVRFSGRVTGAELWSVLAACDVLVLPSRYEAFGRSALDSMVAGKPVLVSENSGIASFVEKAGCGFLVQPTCESICSGLLRAFESRDQWQMIGARGKAFAFANLTWDKITHQAIQSYQRLLS